MAATPYLTDLKMLDLGHNPILDLGVYALANAPSLSRLKDLDLALCHVGPTAAHYLAAAALLGKLENLDLSHNELGDSGVRYLAASKTLPALRRSLRTRQQGDRGGRGAQEGIASGTPVIEKPTVASAP